MSVDIENIIFRKLAEQFPEPILIFNNSNDEIIFYNDSFCRLWNINNKSIRHQKELIELLKNEIDFAKAQLFPNNFSLYTLAENFIYKKDESILIVKTETFDENFPAIKMQRHEILVSNNFLNSQSSTTFKQMFLMLNTIPLPVFYKNREAAFIGCNKAYENFIGIRREKILGRKNPDLMSKEVSAVFEEIETSLFNSPGEIIRELNIKIADGKFHDIIVHIATYYNFEGEVAGIIGIIFDITDQKKAQSILKESEAKLKEINTTKDKFFSVLAHDLKNPFSVILGITRFLTENYNDFSKEEIIESLMRLNNSAEHLFNLFENLLEWSRLQRGSFSFSPKKINLRELSRLSLYPLLINASDKKIIIENNIDERIEIYADEKMIEATIRNLVANAIKYTNEKGQIKLNAIEKDDNTVQVIIEDNGVGMNSYKVHDLFRIETRSSTPGTKNEQGTGLGLVLCKEFVEKNNGSIHAESEIGKGSKFIFTLPASNFVNNSSN